MNISNSGQASSDLFKRSETLGHPTGLFILFLTEMWERFSFYGMRAILTLYMIAPLAEGGLGLEKGAALGIYGTYTMLVYVMSIPGGILADRFIGQKKAVFLGGILLCIGHGVLAVDAVWAFYAGLGLIILGVGSLKPNISTMVGGLYGQGDIRRDKGFTIFYIGINIGAFSASLLVAWVAAQYGWHYGFGLAGIGMVLGQIIYMMGQNHLVGIGDFMPAPKLAGSRVEAPLTKQERDRVIVLLISFLIIIVFWGAFEQAGGLLNIYAQEKINRVVLGYEIPAGVFQGVNSFFIITLGTLVAAYWASRVIKRKESSTLFKMGLGTIIMGLGFLSMAAASWQVINGEDGKGALAWLILAYLLHTVGELCASPTALSFITKLAPAKYGAIMMGVYFAATGFGNKLAGGVGEAAQSEPIRVVAAVSQLPEGALRDSLALNKEEYITKINTYLVGGNYMLINNTDQGAFGAQVTMKDDSRELLLESLEAYKGVQNAPLQGKIIFKKAAKEDGVYEGSIEIDVVQNDREFNTFVFITGFTVAFGLLLLLFLNRLKKLTHGAEDVTDEEIAKATRKVERE